MSEIPPGPAILAGAMYTLPMLQGYIFETGYAFAAALIRASRAQLHGIEVLGGDVADHDLLPPDSIWS